MGTGWHQGPQGYKHVTSGQLTLIKGMQAWEKGKDSFKENKEDNDHVSNIKVKWTSHINVEMWTSEESAGQRSYETKLLTITPDRPKCEEEGNLHQCSSQKRDCDADSSLCEPSLLLWTNTWTLGPRDMVEGWQ